MNKNIKCKKNKNLSGNSGTVKIEWYFWKVLEYLETVIEQELNISQEKWKSLIDKSEQELRDIINEEGAILLSNIWNSVNNYENMKKAYQEMLSKQYARKKELNKKAIEILYSGKEDEYIQRAKKEKLINQEMLNIYDRSFKKNCQLFNYEIANEMRFADIYFEIESNRLFNTKYRTEYMLNKLNCILGDDIEKKIIAEREMQLIEKVKVLMEA